MQRPKVPVSQNALRDQKKESLEALERKCLELQKSINKLNETKKNLEEHIGIALEERTKSLEEKMALVDKSLENVRVREKEAESKVRVLRDEIEKVEKYKSDKEREYKVLYLKIKIKLAEIKEKQVKNEKYMSELKVIEADLKKSIADNVATELRLDDEIETFSKEKASLPGQLEAIELEKKELKEKQAEVADKEQDNIKKEGKILRFAAALDQKEAELIDRDKKEDRDKAVIDKEKEALREEKVDIAVSRQKLKAEETRIKSLVKEVENRDAKLRDREKLFNTKVIGGK